MVGADIAVSPDGIHWTEVSSPGIYAGDEWNLTFDEKEHLFLQYLKRGGKHGRSIWLTTSKDFETWTEPELIFEADDLDQELGIERIKARIADPSMQKHIYNNPDDYNIDVYHMSPFRYESVYLGMPAMYHATGKNTINNTDGFHLLELVSSRDLKNWTRQGDREAFIWICDHAIRPAPCTAGNNRSDHLDLESRGRFVEFPIRARARKIRITREIKRVGGAHQLAWLVGLNFLVDNVIVTHCELTLDWFALTSQRLTQV